MKDYKGYLFVYFTGESETGEQIYFSISKDGLHWKDLNGGNPVLTSKSGEKGVRDPFIIRSAEGDKFFIIATDLRIASGKGWEAAQFSGSRSLVIWESEDLVNWSKERIVEVGIEGAGCVWAPEAIYDKSTGDYMVFWASMVKELEDSAAKQRIYCARTKDFYTFTKAEKYIERENHVIDTTIVEEGGIYYRFSKDETTKNVRVDKGTSLWAQTFEDVSAPVVEDLQGVEGPTVFKFNDRNEWCLMVDQYSAHKGYLPLVIKDLSSGEFRILDSEEYFLGENRKRHGSILNITEEEYNDILEKWEQKLKETAQWNNPILKGLYADPDIALFEDTFYIYPTTDGFVDWSGTKFHVFSSKNMINWKDEGVILDVASDDVAWSVGSAWAPAIAQRNGKYYFYFCAKRPDFKSCIGVAVADNPTGPFIAQKEPMLTLEIIAEEGCSMGQTIDPSVYIEDDGTAYLLFGNVKPAIVKLNEDMVSFQTGTMKNMEGAFDFREAIIVVKKDDLYHFTWSCDDTRSENYHINYGTSDSLYGPIDFKYTLLEKDKEKDILGTGHHSILKVPETNDYYIAYHRFGTPLDCYPEGKGYNREVCLDKIEFDANGLMKVVKPH
jgi:beta-xylosidase